MTNNADRKEALDCWAIVELMGHQRIAGRITERGVAGAQMLQVDVPEVNGTPAFTRFVGGPAIYAINPCDEATATAWAVSLSISSTPILAFDGRTIIKGMVDKHLKGLPAGAPPSEEEEDTTDDGSDLH